MIPAFRILADAVDVTARIRANLAALRLTDRDGMEADQVEITLADPAGTIALPRRGARLSVALGWAGAPLVDKGSFTVDEVGEDGPPDVIAIVARSADFRASLKETREASYSATTLGAILAAIAERNGLKAAIHPDLAAHPIDHLDQTGESDANLVTRLGADHGAVATVKSGRLVFVPAGAGLTAGGALLPAVTLRRQDGDRHSFRATDRDGTDTGVKAKWHDHATGKTMFALAGEEGATKTLKRVYPSRAEAQAAADAAWKRRRRGAHEFRLTLAAARPDLLACQPIRLEGWRPEITGLSWIAGDVTHSLDGEGGFVTEVVANEIVGG